MLDLGTSMSDQEHWDEIAATEADDVEPSATPAQPATRIGRFALLERIGAGAMGEVFAAYDEQLDRKVALMQGRAADAVPLAQQATSLLEQGKSTPVDLADARFVLARGLWEVGSEGGGDRKRAVALARQVRDTLRTLGHAGEPMMGEVEQWLRERQGGE